MTLESRAEDDSGVTLIELLLAVTLSVILIGVLAAALIVGLKGVRATSETLQDSADAQALSVYLTQDLHSVRAVSDVTTGPHVSDCAGSGGTGVLRLHFGPDDGSTVSGFSVSYRYVESTDATAIGNAKRWLLTRYFCRTAPTLGPTLASTVARNLADPASTPPVFTTTLSDRLTARFTDIQTDGSTYQFTIAGTYRTAVEGGGTAPAPPPPAPSPSPTYASPVVLDSNTDGKIDSVRVLFSSPADAACADGWTVTGLPAGYIASTQATLSATRTSATIAFTAFGAYSTAATGVSVSLNQSGACQVSNSGVDIAAQDGAGPLVYQVATTVAGTVAGKMQPSDQIKLAFTEAVKGLPPGATTVAVTEADGTGSANNTLTIGAVTLAVTRGAVDTGGKGSTKYVNSNKTVTASSVLLVAADRRSATVTIGAVITSASELSNGSGPLMFVLASTITDDSDNPSAASAVATASTYGLF